MNLMTVKLGDIVDCAEMNVRRCLHFLDKGVVPLGGQQSVQRGNHRHFEFGHAFDLIVAYRLSELGVPLSRLKQIVATVHRRFDMLKMPVSDDFCPPRGLVRAKFNWRLVVARGEYLVIVPTEYVAAWFRGQTMWYSLKQKKMIEPKRTVSLDLCWLQVPLCPAADCIRPPFSEGFSLTADQSIHDVYFGEPHEHR